jgi:hypothetical protein
MDYIWKSIITKLNNDPDLISSIIDQFSKNENYRILALEVSTNISNQDIPLVIRLDDVKKLVVAAYLVGRHVERSMEINR